MTVFDVLRAQSPVLDPADPAVLAAIADAASVYGDDVITHPPLWFNGQGSGVNSPSLADLLAA